MRQKSRKPSLFLSRWSVPWRCSRYFADLIFTRQRDIDTNERRLQHFSIMMAEHSARAFEGIDVLLRETSLDLSHNRAGWETWAASKGWEYIAQRHSRALTQMRDLIIFDRDGNQRFVSTYFPAPQINVKDRPYFQVIENGTDAATWGPTSDGTPVVTATRWRAASPTPTSVLPASPLPPWSRAICRISAGPTGCPTILNRY